MRIGCNQTEDEVEKKTPTSIDLFDLEEICLTTDILPPPFSHSGHQNQSCRAPLLTHLQETVVAASMKDDICKKKKKRKKFTG